MNIIAVDWGKDVRKRSAYRAELSTRRISRLPFDGSLLSLVEYAATLEPPVLIGIDAAIGFPEISWQGLKKTNGCQSGNFIDFLPVGILPAQSFTTVSKTEFRNFDHDGVSGKGPVDRMDSLRAIGKDEVAIRRDN
mgnify:CR=1 FL=1